MKTATVLTNTKIVFYDNYSKFVKLLDDKTGMTTSLFKPVGINRKLQIESAIRQLSVMFDCELQFTDNSIQKTYYFTSIKPKPATTEISGGKKLRKTPDYWQLLGWLDEDYNLLTDDYNEPLMSHFPLVTEVYCCKHWLTCIPSDCLCLRCCNWYNLYGQQLRQQRLFEYYES
jgi:hypothetical protein